MDTSWLVRATIVGLLPALVVGVSVFAIRNMFLAMVLMHWVAMVPGILVSTYFSKGKPGCAWYWLYLKQQRVRQNTLICIGLFVVAAGAVIGAYVGSTCRAYDWALCIGRVTNNVAEYGFDAAPRWLITVCAVYFASVNPLVEELFWRVFMDHEYLVGLIVPADPDEEQAILSEGEDVSCPHATTRVPPLIRVYFSCLYASYHTMIVGVFLGGVAFGVVSLFALTGLGLIFQFIFANSASDDGYARAVALHAGLDIGVVVAIGDAIGWYSLL